MTINLNEMGDHGWSDDRAIYEIRNISEGASTTSEGTFADHGSATATARHAVLSPELQRESEKHIHLKRYLSTLPMDDIGVPEYRRSLTPEDNRSG